MSHPPVAVLRDGPPAPLVDAGGEAVLLTEFSARRMHRLRLDHAGSTVALRHDDEAAWIVAEGGGAVVDLETGEPVPLAARSVVYVPPGRPYRFRAVDGMVVYGGPCAGERGGPGPVRVLDPERNGFPLPILGRAARAVVWAGMGARGATMNVVRLEAGDENLAHMHLESDDMIVVLEGEGEIEDCDAGRSLPFGVGDVVFVRAGTRHRVRASRGIAVESAGGPCPPDREFLKAQGLIV